MTTLRLIMPSYRPDFELFDALHRSVLRHTDAAVVHEVIVPPQDVPLFRGLSSDRLVVKSTHDYHPRTFVSTYAAAQVLARVPALAMLAKIQVVNVRRPWPPIRGWIMQQLIKLEAASRAETDVVLVLDSDVELIAQLRADDLVLDEAVRFYASPGAVHGGMTDHLAWHAIARSLLGLESAASAPPLDDYVAACVTWDPRLLRSMLELVAQRSGTDWMTAAASSMHFSECILYGLYVAELGPPSARSFQSPDSRCVSHWDAVPLSPGEADALVSRLSASDFAVQIQSTSDTPRPVRDELIRRCRNRMAELASTGEGFNGY